MSESPPGIADLFDQVADTYDAVGVEWFGPIARGLVDRLQPVEGERALDIGCGRGAATIPLASGVGQGGHVLGIDLSPRMILATAADLRHLPQVELRVGDATAPGLAPSSFDVIASSLVLFFLPDPAAAVHVWADLLVPGGRLGVATFAQSDPRLRALDELFTPYLPERMLDARTSGRRGPFASDAGVEALFSGAGLTGVRTESSTVHVTFTDSQHWLAFSWSHGQRAMWESVPTDDRAQVEKDAFTMLEGWRQSDGRIVLDQDIRYTLGSRRGPHRPGS